MRRTPSFFSGPWLLLAAFAAIAAPAVSQTPHPTVQRRVEVVLKPGLDRVETAARLAQGIGRVERFSGDRRFEIRLDGTVTFSKALDRLKGRSSVAEATAVLPILPNDFRQAGSVSTIERVVKELETAHEDYVAATGPDAIVDKPRVGALRGYLHWLRIRAYPEDTIDLSEYRKVFAERLQTDGQVSVQSGPQWEFVGPTNLDIPYRIYYGQRPNNGRMTGIAFHPTDPNTFYSGGDGGVWKTTDRGVNWTPLSDGWPTLEVGCVEVDPNNPNVVFAGTGDFHYSTFGGIGIMKSTDGGQTWAAKGFSTFGPGLISDILVHPDDSNVVFATVCGFGGSRNQVFRSTDGGETWAEAWPWFDNWQGLAVTVPKNGVRSVYAIGRGNPPTLLRTDDKGATWQVVTITGLSGYNGTTDIAASKVFPDTLYVLAGGSQRIVKTTNGGGTWSDVTNNFPGGYNWSQAWYDYAIDVGVATVGGQPQDMVLVGLIDIAVSVNGGQSWRNTGGENYTATYNGAAIVHNDQHGVRVSPIDPSTWISAGDGGVYLGRYNGANDTVSWDILNKNLGVTQFYTMAAHPTNPDILKGGTQDNATPHSFGDLQNWRNPGAGDGAGCLISPENPNLQFNSYQGQNISRTDNAYGSQRSVTPNWSGHSVPFIGYLWFDPNTSRYMYANTNFLNRYDVQTGQWSLRLGGQPLGNIVLTYDAARGDSNRIVVGTGDGRVQLSSDFGATFTRIDRQGQQGGLPNRAVTGASLSPSNKNDVVVVMSGTSGPKAYRCFDVTAATPQWVPVSGSGANALPAVGANCIVRDTTSPETTWYVGTDVGVYMTRDAGGSWSEVSASRGKPRVPVYWMTAMPGTGYVTASTWGRGMWRLRMQPPQTLVPPTGFQVALGRRDAGNLASLTTVDGDALRVCRFVVPNQQVDPVNVEVTSTAPGNTLSELTFRSTSRATLNGLFGQSLDLFDYSLNQWSATATRTDALTTGYQTVDLVVGTNPGQFRGPNNELRARYRVRTTGPVANPAWCVETDQATFLVRQ